ncbi:hypothetical protein CR162_13425 [Pseudoroseomonas rhizosphaerae]|uniref:Protein TonB n=1 Tax=Teichococcus rhizosphaerae TaxID=1335062 RepID=A0A2C7ABM0_9PROT|nr:energy transducer TonB [Pseudoroseomonas rhizosphaerae]PHK94484.1 hypothetical protein CR162_13425 [Pseudoroseomonas rhizosphaerae]
MTAPPPGGRPGPPRLALGRGLAASLLVHAALALWLLWSHEPEPLPQPSEAESVPVVFESAMGEAGPALPQPQEPVGAPETPGGVPTPLAPPDISAPPSPVQPLPVQPLPVQPLPVQPPPVPSPPVQPPPVMAAPAPPPAPSQAPPANPPPAPPPALPSLAEAPPAPPAPPVAEAPPAPSEAPVAPPAPARMAEAPPAPEGELPTPPPAPLPDLSAALAPPTPLRLNPPRPPPPPPRPPEEAPPRPNPLAGTLNLGPMAARPIAPAPQPRPAPARPGQLDMAVGPVPQRSRAPEPPAFRGNNSMVHVSGAQPGLSWGRAFQAWVQSRGFYPPQAAAAGEDGPVVLRVTVARDGRIEAVQITSRSGSRWLDAAALSLFRDQVGPAFTADMEGDSTTLAFTVNYRIIYR